MQNTGETLDTTRHDTTRRQGTSYDAPDLSAFFSTVKEIHTTEPGTTKEKTQRKSMPHFSELFTRRA